MRAAEDNDEALARSTHHAAYHDVVIRQFGRWDVPQQDAFFDSAWSPSTHEIILIDGAPCGYCCIERRREDVHIRELVIDPAFQNRGVGSAVLRQLQSEGKVRRVPLRLGTFHQNRALALYSRLGFLEIDRTETHVLMEWRADLDARGKANALHANEAAERGRSR
jgi:ribosomal protein S18 acetylase RimI-like enzyme